VALQTPPWAVIRTVERYASSGFWTVFFAAANRALVPGDKVTSWYRDAGFNWMVGGDEDSQHLAAAAFDAVPRQNTVSGRAGLARRLAAAGFVVAVESDHVHAQAWRASAARRAGLLGALGV